LRLDLREKAGHLTAFSKSLFQNQPGFGTSSIILRIIQGFYKWAVAFPFYNEVFLWYTWPFIDNRGAWIEN
jgi:hypothetical protein